MAYPVKVFAGGIVLNLAKADASTIEEVRRQVMDRRYVVSLAERLGEDPMPTSQHPWTRTPLYGNFFVNRSIFTVAPQASTVGKKLGLRFATRAEGKGTRVYRVE